jgi:hypothetical protein
MDWSDRVIKRSMKHQQWFGGHITPATSPCASVAIANNDVRTGDSPG